MFPLFELELVFEDEVVLSLFVFEELVFSFVLELLFDEVELSLLLLLAVPEF